MVSIAIFLVAANYLQLTCESDEMQHHLQESGKRVIDKTLLLTWLFVLIDVKI